MSHYCHIHGEYPEYRDGCPDCQTAEDRAESNRAEMLDRLSTAEYKRANPGDFQCPSCRYKTLLRQASRCPMCHATIEGQYWADVESAEKRKEKARARVEELRRKREAKEAEEWKRAEPARLAAEAAAAAAKRKADAQKKRKSVLLTYLNLLWIAPVCGFSGFLLGDIIGGIIGTFDPRSTAAIGGGVGETIGLRVGVLVAFILVAIMAHC